MSAARSETPLQELAQAAYGNVFDVLRAHGVEVGSRRRSLRCPLHDDRSPSFSVYEGGARWKCFSGCGAGGVIELVAALRQVEASTVCSELRRGERVHLQPATMPTPRQKAQRPEIDAGTRAEIVTRLWSQLTPWAEHTREAWRGYDPDMLDELGIVYGHCGGGTGPSWQKIRADLVRRYGSEAVKAAGVLRTPGTTVAGGEWYTFRSFAAFPYLDEAAQVVLLRFRNLDPDAPKDGRWTQLGGMRGSRLRPFLELEAFEGLRRSNGLWPREGYANALVVCEGETDTLAAWASSVAAVGIPGASAWRDEWAADWKELERVVVMPDGDDAGGRLWESVATACRKLHGEAWTTKHLRRRTLPPGADLADVLMGRE